MRCIHLFIRSVPWVAAGMCTADCSCEPAPFALASHLLTLCQSFKTQNCRFLAAMWAVVVASATPAPRVTVPNVSSSRAPDLSSGMRRITPQRSIRQLSTSAVTNRSPYRGKQHATQVPVTQHQHEAATPNDSTWWSDPDSGERRRVKLSKFRTLMLDQSYRPIAVVKCAFLTDYLRCRSVVSKSMNPFAAP